MGRSLVAWRISGSLRRNSVLVVRVADAPFLLAAQVAAGVASGPAAWWRQSLSRLWVSHSSFHSAVQAASPRRWNRRAPRTSLSWPKTGSTVCLRQLSDPLLIPALALGRLSLQQGLGLPQPGQPAGGAGELGRELVPAGIPEQLILLLVGFGGLPQDLGDLVLELVVGAVGPLGGVGGQLGAIQR